MQPLNVYWKWSFSLHGIQNFHFILQKLYKKFTEFIVDWVVATTLVAPPVQKKLLEIVFFTILNLYRVKQMLVKEYIYNIYHLPSLLQQFSQCTHAAASSRWRFPIAVKTGPCSISILTDIAVFIPFFLINCGSHQFTTLYFALLLSKNSFDQILCVCI
jgi:hypothetical protein